MALRVRTFAAVLLLVGAATASVSTRQNPRTLGTTGAETFASRVVASDLANPWEVTWGPDGQLWITERTAFRVTRVNPADGAKKVALTLAAADVYQTSVQDGLMGLALHPDLLRSRGRDFVYLAYTYDADPGAGVTRRMRVRRYTYDAAAQTLGSPLDLLDNLPAHDDHGGGRLAIGPDGKLYLSRGDQGSNWLVNSCNAIHAQDLPSAADIAARDWTNYQGKILRMELDGAIPADNPTIGGVRSHIYSYGFRNPQGLTFGSTGLLYASEHGPSTDDEIDLGPGREELRLAPRRRLQRRPRLRLRQLVGVVPGAVCVAEVRQPESAGLGALVQRVWMAAPGLRRAAHHLVHRPRRVRPGEDGQRDDRPGQHRVLRLDGDSRVAPVAAGYRDAYRHRLPREAER